MKSAVGVTASRYPCRLDTSGSIDAVGIIGPDFSVPGPVRLLYVVQLPEGYQGAPESRKTLVDIADQARQRGNCLVTGYVIALLFPPPGHSP